MITPMTMVRIETANATSGPTAVIQPTNLRENLSSFAIDMLFISEPLSCSLYEQGVYGRPSTRSWERGRAPYFVLDRYAMPSIMDMPVPAMDMAVFVHAHDAAARTRKMQQRVTGNQRMGMRSRGYRQQQHQ